MPFPKYDTINRFGKCIETPTNERFKHPLTMCLTDTMDRKFVHGSEIGNMTGPHSRKCQLYMSDHCSQQWDGYCEYFYNQYQTTGKPHEKRYPVTNARPWEVQSGAVLSLNTGDQMLRNTAEKKYCTHLNCEPQFEKFNPMDPTSVSVRFFADKNGYESTCIPVCKVDTQTIDSDPVMDRMLQKPTAAAMTLINICNTSKNNNIDLSGTKIGTFCQQYLSHQDKMVG